MTEDLNLTSGPTDAPATSGCACCAPAPGSASAAPEETGPTDAVRASYEVAGMTCGHCVTAVRSELSGLQGVSDVEIDLVAGGTSTVTVTSATALGDDAVAEAVDEAGYELLGRRS